FLPVRHTAIAGPECPFLQPMAGHAALRLLHRTCRIRSPVPTSLVALPPRARVHTLCGTSALLFPAHPHPSGGWPPAPPREDGSRPSPAPAALPPRWAHSTLPAQ